MKIAWFVLAILLLGACADDRRQTSSFAITDEMRMVYSKFATSFATALTDGEYEAAFEMLSADMRRKYSADELGNRYEEMVGYGGSPARVDGFIQTMEDWPDKRPEDVGWAYVSISGDDYAEAVTVIVSADESGMSISSIEWGRP